jgi:sugar O-acyltransferase (sialic acid O-acetyltransferase NeuD family)
MTRRLVILGASGNALDILDVVAALNDAAAEWEVVGLLDDRAAVSEFAGHKVLGPLKEAAVLEGCWFVNAIGSDRTHRRRREILATVQVPAARFATLVHPRATVSPRTQLGRGVCVNAGVVIGANGRVGDHAWFGAGCVIGHDTTVGDYATVAPGAVVSGGVTLGDSCYVGAGSVLRQNVRIGERALVGLGAVVLRDVPSGEVVVGNPARRLERAAPLSQ